MATNAGRLLNSAAMASLASRGRSFDERLFSAPFDLTSTSEIFYVGPLVRGELIPTIVVSVGFTTSTVLYKLGYVLKRFGVLPSSGSGPFNASGENFGSLPDSGTPIREIFFHGSTVCEIPLNFRAREDGEWFGVHLTNLVNAVKGGLWCVVVRDERFGVLNGDSSESESAHIQAIETIGAFGGPGDGPNP